MQPENLEKANKQARELLSTVETWLSEDNAEYALGKDAPYTMADVMMTIFLMRLKTNDDFFQKEVLNRNNMREYWQRMQERESFSLANIAPVHAPSIGSTLWIVILM